MEDERKKTGESAGKMGEVLKENEILKTKLVAMAEDMNKLKVSVRAAFEDEEATKEKVKELITAMQGQLQLSQERLLEKEKENLELLVLLKKEKEENVHSHGNRSAGETKGKGKSRVARAAYKQEANDSEDEDGPEDEEDDNNSPPAPKGRGSASSVSKQRYASLQDPQKGSTEEDAADEDVDESENLFKRKTKETRKRSSSKNRSSKQLKRKAAEVPLKVGKSALPEYDLTKSTGPQTDKFTGGRESTGGLKQSNSKMKIDHQALKTRTEDNLKDPFSKKKEARTAVIAKALTSTKKPKTMLMSMENGSARGERSDGLGLNHSSHYRSKQDNHSEEGKQPRIGKSGKRPGRDRDAESDQGHLQPHEKQLLKNKMDMISQMSSVLSNFEGRIKQMKSEMSNLISK